MRAVVQRVTNAMVSIGGRLHGAIDYGLLAYVGIEADDQNRDLQFVSEKVLALRIFDDDQGKMNRSLIDLASNWARAERLGILIISQFTLLGDCRKGRRPSYHRAENPERAETLYNQFVSHLRAESRRQVGEALRVETGQFQAMMEVQATNMGPVTLILESRPGLDGRSTSAT